MGADCPAESVVKVTLRNSKTTSDDATDPIEGYCGAFSIKEAYGNALLETEGSESIAYASKSKAFTLSLNGGSGAATLSVSNEGVFYPNIIGAIGTYVFSPNVPSNIGVYTGQTEWLYTIGLGFADNSVKCKAYNHNGGVPDWSSPSDKISSCDVNGQVVTLTAATDSGVGFVVALDGVTNTGTRKITGEMKNFDTVVASLLLADNKVVGAPWTTNMNTLTGLVFSKNFK